MKYVISVLSLKTSETGKYDPKLKLQGGGHGLQVFWSAE